MKQTAIVVGDLLVDEIGDAEIGDAEIGDGGRTRYAGGAGYNTAVGLADHGLVTHLIATIGDDHFGQQLRADAASHRVTVWSPRSNLATGLAVSARLDGEPHYEFNEGVTQRFWSFTGIDPIPPTWLVVNSYNFGVPEDVERLLEFVAAGGHRLVIDPNVRPTLLTDLAAYRGGVLSLAATASVVKLSVADLAILDGETVDGSSNRFVDELLAGGVECVVTTKGASGATVTLAGQPSIQVPAPLGGPIVDTMGAGDAVTAGIVAGLLERGDLDVDVSMVDWSTIVTGAMQLARAVISHPGGHANVTVLAPAPSD